jgi:hypothetical protein
LNSLKTIYVSTISSDSIEKENEQFYDTFLLQIIADERQLIRKLTQRCSSMDSLDNDTVSSSSKTSSMM